MGNIKDLGEDHWLSTIDTPLKKDAFELSDQVDKNFEPYG